MDFNNPNPNVMDTMAFTDDSSPPPVIPTPSMQVNETQFMHELNLSTTNCDINDVFEGLSFLDDDFLNDIINNDVSGEISNDSGSNNPLPFIPTPSMQVNESQIMHELDLSTTNCDTIDESDGLSFLDDDFSIPWDIFEVNDNINNDVSKEIGNDNGSSNVVGTTRLEVSTRAFGHSYGPGFDTGGTSTIRIPVTPTISDGVRTCNYCNVLRALVHSDGYETNILEIRGGVGFFCHAILEIRPFAVCKERRYQTINLKDLTMEEVKIFIEHYCLQRVTQNLLLLQDTNAAFYRNANTIHNQSQTLTIPSTDVVPMSLVMPDHTLNVPSVIPYVGLREESGTGKPKERRRRQTPLAAQRKEDSEVVRFSIRLRHMFILLQAYKIASFVDLTQDGEVTNLRFCGSSSLCRGQEQRERTGKLTLKDICMNFHLPIEAAAKKMNMCPSALKNVCRKGGLTRWPHRTIKSLERKITLVRTAKDEAGRANAEAEIDRLQKEIEKICNVK